MWRPLPDDIIRERAALLAQSPRVPRWLKMLIAIVLFGAALFGILRFNEIWQRGQGVATAGLQLQSASLPALVAVFAVTVFFMYYLVKSRKPLVIHVCYDCQEPFHAAPQCPACGSGNVADIRLAEWTGE